MGWDDEIFLKDLYWWCEWLDDLFKLGEYIIDCCIKLKVFGDVVMIELYYFFDVFEIGYGVVFYLRIVNERREIYCCLVMVKLRLVLIKLVIIFRMELLVVVFVIRFDIMIC